MNEDHYQNVISDKEAINLWKPVLEFTNSNEEQVLKYDLLTSDMMIRRSGSSIKAPQSQKDEARVFNSSETEITWRTVHFKKFKCQFDLYYLPFDQQTCYVKVKAKVHFWYVFVQISNYELNFLSIS